MFVCALCFALRLETTMIRVHASHIKAAFLCKCFSSVLTSDKLPGNILRNSGQSTCILVNFIGITMESSPSSTWRTPTVRGVGGRASGGWLSYPCGDRRRDERRTPARRRDMPHRTGRLPQDMQPYGVKTLLQHEPDWRSWRRLWSQDPASAVEELEAHMESTTTSVQVSAAAL